VDENPTDMGKELEPYAFDDDEQENSGSTGVGLDDDLAQQMNGFDLNTQNLSNTGWTAEDMLLTNETKYGYKSTFKDDLSEYTLQVEREDTEEFKRREEEAEKLALEIESSSTYKRNIDKELSDGEEEEEKFSAVVRSSHESSNAANSNNNNNNNNQKEFYSKNDKFYGARRSFNKQLSGRTSSGGSTNNNNNNNNNTNRNFNGLISFRI
jgi:PAB1-binding protein PBP1